MRLAPLLIAALTVAACGTPSGMASPPLAAPTYDTAVCYDAIVVGRVIRQRFADLTFERAPDTIFGPAPGVFEIEVVRVIYGRLPARRLKAHSTVAEYLRKDRTFEFRLRRNTLGQFNLVSGEEPCAPTNLPVPPYVPKGVRLLPDPTSD